MKVKSFQPLLVSIMLFIAVACGLWSCGGKHEEESFVIGVVALTDVDNSTFAGFKEGMEQLGYIEGKNVTYLADGPAQEISKFDSIISNYLSKGVDLFLVSSTPGTMAVQKATKENKIPVVFAPVNDPVGAGIVKELKYPGNNITGIKLPTGDKLRLQWLKKIVPSAKKIYIPYNPKDKSALASLAQAEEAAATIGMTIIRGAVLDPGGINRTIGVVPDGIDAIFLPRDSSIESMIEEIVRISKARKLPVSAPSLTQVHAGALYTYGFIHSKFGKQAAHIADQILRGTEPANIPVEIAQNYLVINYQTAKELDMELSNTILRQADFIIRQ